jgi:peptide/nickel transport system ATP-binding protein
MAILFVARDMGVVAETADRTVVMYNGEVVEAGTTADIFRQPQHPYTKALLAAVPKLGSMNGRARPMRFPIVDRSTGTSDIPTEVPDTVKDQERPLLQVSNLTTRFPIHSAIRGRITGRVHAVENVSFDLRAGEDPGAGRGIRLRQVDHRALLAAAGRTGGRFGPPRRRGCAEAGRRQAARAAQAHPDDLPGPVRQPQPRDTVGAAIAEPLVIHGLTAPAGEGQGRGPAGAGRAASSRERPCVQHNESRKAHSLTAVPAPSLCTYSAPRPTKPRCTRRITIGISNSNLKRNGASRHSVSW